jgi:hypothetical protein
VWANEEVRLSFLICCGRTLCYAIEKKFLQKVIGGVWLGTRPREKTPRNADLPCDIGPQGDWRLQQNPHSSPWQIKQINRTHGLSTPPELFMRRLWWQWQNGRNRFKELRRRGVPKFRAAVAAGSPTGFWRMAGHPAVQQALRNRYFDSIGLPRLFVSSDA